MPGAGIMLAWSAVALGLYLPAADTTGPIMIDIFAIGFGGSPAIIPQTTLMDVAGGAQGLAAALNHAAFNIANALGRRLDGIAITAGYGFGSKGIVGAGLAIAGPVVWAAASAADHR